MLSVNLGKVYKRRRNDRLLRRIDHTGQTSRYLSSGPPPTAQLILLFLHTHREAVLDATDGPRCSFSGTYESTSRVTSKVPVSPQFCNSPVTHKNVTKRLSKDPCCILPAGDIKHPLPQAAQHPLCRKPAATLFLHGPLPSHTGARGSLCQWVT